MYNRPGIILVLFTTESVDISLNEQYMCYMYIMKSHEMSWYNHGYLCCRILLHHKGHNPKKVQLLPENYRKIKQYILGVFLTGWKGNTGLDKKLAHLLLLPASKGTVHKINIPSSGTCLTFRVGRFRIKSSTGLWWHVMTWWNWFREALFCLRASSSQGNAPVFL